MDTLVLKEIRELKERKEIKVKMVLEVIKDQKVMMEIREKLGTKAKMEKMENKELLA